MSEGETTLALGWQGMLNKRFVMLTALVVATTTTAQENAPTTAPETPMMDQTSDSSAGIIGTESNTALASGDPAQKSAEQTGTADSDLSKSEPSADDYRATERISEDRSVSFPVDI